MNHVAPSSDVGGGASAYDELRTADDCRGVPGVTVHRLDANDALIAATVTNAAGNRGIETEDVADPGQFRVVLQYQGRAREMGGHRATPGDCSSCHPADGAEVAPGRVRRR